MFFHQHFECLIDVFIKDTRKYNKLQMCVIIIMHIMFVYYCDLGEGHIPFYGKRQSSGFQYFFLATILQLSSRQES